MDDSAFPDFPEALNQFGDFLEKCGLPRKIVWVAPEHTIYCGRSWKVFSGESVGEDTVSDLYSLAARGDFGLRFKLLCAGKDASYCYLHTPLDLQEAEQSLLFLHRVKYTIPSVAAPAEIIKRWSLPSFWYQLKEIPKLRWKCYAFSQKWIYEKNPSPRDIPEFLQNRSESGERNT